MSSIQIRLFGAFRDLAPSGVLQIPFNGNETAIQLKSRITANLMNTVAGTKKAHFDVQALVEKSALATESRVLRDSDVVTEETWLQGRNLFELAILPPVCGG